MQYVHTKFVPSRYRDLHKSELRGIIHTEKILRNRERDTKAATTSTPFAMRFGY